MNIGGVSSSPLPLPKREEMMAIVAARPAALQLQSVALAGTGTDPTARSQGSSGQGTPSVDGNSGIDVYA